MYETSDVDSESEAASGTTAATPTATTTADANIVEAPVDFLQSFARFNNEFVNGKVNFNYVSDAPLNQNGYKVYKDESNEQKLDRIAKELAELKIEGSKDTRIEEMLAIAEGKNLQSNVYLKQLEDIWKVGEKLQLEREFSSGNTNDKTEMDDIIELDKKIAILEAKFGSISVPLQSTINDLERKINIINNPQYHVESVKKSITSLLESPEYAKLNNSGMLDTYKDDKLQELVTHVSDIDQYIADSDRLVERLRALNSVHMSRIDSQTFVASFESLFTNMAAEITKWEASMVEIAGKLDENIANFNNNKQEISLWVSQLLSKVNTLQNDH